MSFFFFFLFLFLFFLIFVFVFFCFCSKFCFIFLFFFVFCFCFIEIDVKIRRVRREIIRIEKSNSGTSGTLSAASVELASKCEARRLRNSTRKYKNMTLRLCAIHQFAPCSLPKLVKC